MQLEPRAVVEDRDALAVGDAARAGVGLVQLEQRLALRALVARQAAVARVQEVVGGLGAQQRQGVARRQLRISLWALARGTPARQRILDGVLKPPSA